ncbi:MAG: ATP-binding protein [Kiritimatiellia bacterium]|nr:HAMP domain-containing protein [Lentisphaerota bacterium]
MRRRSLSWRVYSTFLAATLFALGAMTWHTAIAFRNFHQDFTAEALLKRATLFSREITMTANLADTDSVDTLCNELGRLTDTRVTVMLPDGQVVGDSEEDPGIMDNHSWRPEMAAALQGKTGRALRFSNTLERHMLYMAIPVRSDGVIVAVVRTATPLEVISFTLRTVYRQLASGALLIAVLFAMIALWLSRRISRPLEQMRAAAAQIARGEFNVRIPPNDDAEIGGLSRALNEMAGKLGRRMDTITRQRNQQEAVFGSMVEGVVAVDLNQRVIHINSSATELLGRPREQAQDLDIRELTRSRQLLDFLQTAATSPTSTEREIILHTDRDIHLQLRGTDLLDEQQRKIGVVIVMHDITRLKRLETMRRDFVANVSHELKTPITALKGCVETLAQDSAALPADSRGFIDMMDRQLDRLQAIIEDLLSLSRLEFNAENNQIPLEFTTIHSILQRAVRQQTGQADQRKIALKLNCPDNLAAPVNAQLLEEAVGNLIDNAVKYSAEQTEVAISAEAIDESLVIRVADQGPGIEARHLDRIFERFYRVDQARSRSMGGTGLGLAIVRHIALAHHGQVAVQSTPGHGSTFSIMIPRRQEPPEGGQKLAVMSTSTRL